MGKSKAAAKEAKVVSKKAKKVKQPPPQESESSDDSDGSEEEAMEVEVTKPTKKATPMKNGNKAEESNEESSSDEEEETVPVKAKGKTTQQKKSEDDDNDDDSSSEEEEEKAAPAKKATPAAKESSSEEDSSEEEEEETKPAAPKQAAKEESSDEDDDDDDDDEEDDDEEEKPAKNNQKRKADTEEETVTKKAKVDEEKITLFCGNLTNDTEEKQLKKFFKKSGIKVSDVRKIEKKKFGYVDLENKEDLDKALELNGSDLNGNAIKVEQAAAKTPNKEFASGREKMQKKQQGREGKEEEDKCTLFVKNLSWSTTSEGLQEYFPDCVDVRIPMNEEGRPKGFAFVQFESEDKAESVLKEMQGTEIDGRAIMVDYVGQKSKFTPKKGGFDSPQGNRRQSVEPGNTKVLIIKNLSYSTTQDGLREHFENVSDVRMLTDRDTGRPRGIAFLEFSSPDEAKSAYETMNNQEIDGRAVKLDFAEDRGSGGGGRGGFRGGRGGGRGGGGRGGFGGRGGGRGGGRFDRGGGRGRGRGGPPRGAMAQKKGSIQEFQGSKKKFVDDD